MGLLVFQCCEVFILVNFLPRLFSSVLTCLLFLLLFVLYNHPIATLHYNQSENFYIKLWSWNTPVKINKINKSFHLFLSHLQTRQKSWPMWFSPWNSFRFNFWHTLADYTIILYHILEYNVFLLTLDLKECYPSLSLAKFYSFLGKHSKIIP